MLLAYRDGRSDNGAARRGLEWLDQAQNPDGGLGGREVAGKKKKPSIQSSTEETALAMEALLSWPVDSRREATIKKGLDRLLTEVEADRYRIPSPIGLYFAKLWYHEKLYPLIFTVSALGQALRAFLPHPARQAAAARRDA